MRLIGLTGPAGSGKDTVAEFLCATQGFVQIALADPIRAGLKAMLGLDDDTLSDRASKEEVLPLVGRSPRELMQSLGTAWGRDCVDPWLWMRLAHYKILRYQTAPKDQHISGIVVSDIRLQDEAAWLYRLGGKLYHVHRTTMAYTGLASNTRLHRSEQGVEFCDGDRIIHNAGSIDDLYETLGNLFTQEEAS